MKKKKFADIQNRNYMEHDIIEILISQVGEFSTVDSLAKVLKVSRTTISRAIDAGDIVAFHFGKRLIIVTQSVEDYIHMFF